MNSVRPADWLDMEIDECLLHFKRILRCIGMRWGRVSASHFVRNAVFHRGIEHQRNAILHSLRSYGVDLVSVQSI